MPRPALRIVSALRRFGVLDGLWTVAATVGSKAQTLLATALAGYLTGPTGLASVMLSIAVGLVAYSMIDLGLSPQTVRVFAANGISGPAPVMWACARRLGGVLPVTVAVWIITGGTGGILAAPTWPLLIACYAGAFLVSTVATQAAFGCGLFRRASLINGLSRLASLLLLYVLTLVLGPFGLLVGLALTEAAIAGLQFWSISQDRRLVKSYSSRPELLLVKNSWRFGLASVINVISNRSDVAIVAIVGSTATVGVYGLASQIENALTVAALVPAAAVTALAARGGELNRRRHRVVVGASVIAVYTVLATPWLIWTGPLTQIFFNVDPGAGWPIRVCIVAGIFSALAGVCLMQLTGMGAQATVLRVWAIILIVAISTLVAGGALGDAMGAALGALCRDLTLFGLAVWFIARHERNLGRANLL